MQGDLHLAATKRKELCICVDFAMMIAPTACLHTAMYVCQLAFIHQTGLILCVIWRRGCTSGLEMLLRAQSGVALTYSQEWQSKAIEGLERSSLRDEAQRWSHVFSRYHLLSLASLPHFGKEQCSQDTQLTVFDGFTTNQINQNVHDQLTIPSRQQPWPDQEPPRKSDWQITRSTAKYWKRISKELLWKENYVGSEALPTSIKEKEYYLVTLSLGTMWLLHHQQKQKKAVGIRGVTSDTPG